MPYDLLGLGFLHESDYGFECPSYLAIFMEQLRMSLYPFTPFSIQSHHHLTTTLLQWLLLIVVACVYGCVCFDVFF